MEFYVLLNKFLTGEMYAFIVQLIVVIPLSKDFITLGMHSLLDMLVVHDLVRKVSWLLETCAVQWN